MRYPEFIKKKDVIGFVAPSFGCATEPYKSAFENAKRKLGERGYGADVGPNCYRADGIGISSSPESCGREFTGYYVSGENAALISCGGGELMCETLDYVDFGAIAQAKPKWFMGYSDNTNMTFLLTTLCDTASIYGPNAGAFGMEPWHRSVEDALQVLEGERTSVSNYEKWEKESLKSPERPYEPYHVTEAFRLRNFVNGQERETVRMSGRLLGGCLDCLANLVGTAYDRVSDFVEEYRSDGFIWFLESCDLNVMGIRRALWQLDRSGWFKHVRGFMIGRPYCHGQEFMGLNQYEAVLGIIGKYGVPVVMDADIGHLAPMMPLVTGSVAAVETKEDTLKIDMKYI